MRIKSLELLATGNDDHVLTLVIERLCLWDACSRRYDPKDEEAFNALVDATREASDLLDEEIVDAVATSKAGVIAQVELLVGDEDGNIADDGELVDRLAASIKAGILATQAAGGAMFRAAEREIVEADRLAQAAATDQELQPIYQRHEAACDFIELTEPQSLTAVAVKLRRLLVPEAPLAGFDREIDSVRQCIAFLEREIAAQGEPAPAKPPEIIGFGEPGPGR
jgi:hypothetical protein